MNTLFADLQTPSLLIDLDRVKANIHRTIELLDGQPERWQPHVKTAKIAQVQAMLLQAGVRHFKCATSREADSLLQIAQQPIDLLVAMAHQGANLRRIVGIREVYPEHRISILTEEPSHAAFVRDISPHIGLYVDLDPGFKRTGIPIAERERIMSVTQAAGDRLRGFHCYEGHFGKLSPEERRAAGNRLYPRLIELAEELGLTDSEIITSGTPSFLHASQHPSLIGRSHRVSPGTVVYWDLQSEKLELSGYRFAATILATVISRPSEDRLTVDAGSKALDATSGDPCVAVEGWPGLIAQNPSEEHTPLIIREGQAPALGSQLRLISYHVCPTINLADEAVLLENGELKDIVPVSARGHETRIL